MSNAMTEGQRLTELARQMKAAMPEELTPEMLAEWEEARVADMVRRVTFEEVEAEWMADPEVRAAAEALEPQYQRDRARIAARLKPRNSGKYRRCERCGGRGGIPEKTTLDGEPTGRLIFCPVCLGLGKVRVSSGS